MANARDLSILAQGASTAGILSGSYGGTSLSSVGSAGNVLFNADGTNWSSTQKIVRGTSVSASGTAVDFTSIPSWVKRITIILNGVSLSSTANLLFQIGTGGTPTTTGYVGNCGIIGGSGTTAVSSSTSGIPLILNSAATNCSGAIFFFNQTSNTWVCNGNTSYSGAGGMSAIGGNVALAGTLDMVRITNTATGTNSFDAGSVNILYE